MGYVRVKAKISNPANQTKQIELECLVDTGAIYTMIPRDLLNKIDIGKSGSRRFKLANGKVEEYEVGEARVEIDEVAATSLVVFGPENATPLLGVTTLELLGFQVDPISGQIKPLEFYLL